MKKGAFFEDLEGIISVILISIALFCEFILGSIFIIIAMHFIIKFW